ncbi:serine hydrolase [Phycicoccus sonneratiae]|uniref:Beta-lactamase n=1 Tax=Phycicoccus sonneratiae TaxID=2807628 RepID=A0ABS2CP07_9MICO|nr:serine hydrolase [Phycicoccus sonneraticus]MBM6400794.1 serine hydrolase [Phycicoccus sonneraticus]
MGTSAPGRREVVRAGSVGIALGALGLGAAPAAAAGVDTPAQLTAALDRYMATRAGNAGLMVRDNRTGRYFAWRPPLNRHTHSTIKVLVLITTLKIMQDRGQGLTSSQKSLASRMIRSSDNDATDALVRFATLRRLRIVADQIGLRETTVHGSTVFRAPTWWGHSTSSPRDLVQTMNQLVLGTYLTSDRRAYARSLMASVTPSQTWGLGDGLPSSVHVELKNGWGPRSDGYRLNGVGHVSGQGRSFQLAFMSRSHNGYGYGQETVNRLCRIVFDALDQPLA